MGEWGRGKAGRSPLLGGLGGPGWGDGPTRIYTAVLVLGLLLRGLQDLQEREKVIYLLSSKEHQHSACVSLVLFFLALPEMST